MRARRRQQSTISGSADFYTSYSILGNAVFKALIATSETCSANILSVKIRQRLANPLATLKNV
jgi:hypothetical protein